jgi:hypothetical protein
MTSDSLFDLLVPSYFEIESYEIVILQDPEGNLLTLKIAKYEGE